MSLMNKTPTTRRIDSTLPRPTVAQRRALCSHILTIELSDGVQVCVTCEAVIPAKAVAA
jgi:hypothetical protein